MCGIVAYIGHKQATPILLSGLKRLEYRGYDSAGIAVLNDGKLERVRALGKIENLSAVLADKNIIGNIGVAHTRWATHGGVTEENTHPHGDCQGDLMLVHNGIIENYRELKEKLVSHKFVSETDTEVLAHLIEENYQGDLYEAVKISLKEVRGTYGLVVIHKNEPDKLVVARMGSPIVVGLGEGEYFIASDASPMLAYTKKVIFLNDGEIAKITKDELEINGLESSLIKERLEMISWDESEAEKQGYPDFMLKEIFDQPSVFLDAVRGRLVLEEGTANLGGLNMTAEERLKIKKIILLACGTAYHAGLVGKYLFERLSGITTEVEVASEWRYRDAVVDEDTLVFAISQSGETADTLAAIREAKRKGAKIRGIVNVVGSTIARETDGGTYIHAGPELAVASTKAFTNMVAVLTLYALEFGRGKRVSLTTGEKIIQEIKKIPEKMNLILKQSENIKSIAEKYSSYKNFFFLGRGFNYPVALEGSLKLKEITYLHSEAYPGGEMKHGPISLLSEEFPVVAIVTKNRLYDKMVSNIAEARARKSPVLAVATFGDEEIKDISDDVIFVPETMEILEPLLNAVALQLFSYYSAKFLGRDVDRPRNLAKSVTVE